MLNQFTEKQATRNGSPGESFSALLEEIKAKKQPINQDLSRLALLNVTNTPELGLLVKTSRELTGKGQHEVAKEAGHSDTYQLKIERGEVIPSPHKMKQIALAVGLQPELSAQAVLHLRMNQDTERSGTSEHLWLKQRLTALLLELEPVIDKSTLKITIPNFVEEDRIQRARLQKLLNGLSERVRSGKISMKDGERIYEGWKAILSEEAIPKDIFDKDILNFDIVDVVSKPNRI